MAATVSECEKCSRGLCCGFGCGCECHGSHAASGSTAEAQLPPVSDLAAMMDAAQASLVFEKQGYERGLRDGEARGQKAPQLIRLHRDDLRALCAFIMRLVIATDPVARKIGADVVEWTDEVLTSLERTK